MENKSMQSNLKRFRKENNPKEMNKIVQETDNSGHSLATELPIDDLKLLYKKIRNIENKRIRKETAGLKKYCHGTSSSRASEIKKRGLVPLLELGKGDFTKANLNPTENPEKSSFLDRVYLGDGEHYWGVEKCVASAFHSSGKLNNLNQENDSEIPTVLFFDGSVEELDMVADEDAQDSEWSQTAKDSATNPPFFSVAVRETIDPEYIDSIYTFDDLKKIDWYGEDKAREMAKKICRYIGQPTLDCFLSMTQNLLEIRDYYFF